VPKVGFEPTRPFEQSILSAPRLPFRHSGQYHVLKSNGFGSRAILTSGI